MELPVLSKTKSFNPEELIDLSMKFYSNFIINTDEKISGPCLFTIKAKEIEKEEEMDDNRTPIDLICVIDRSGSMGGQNKMNLVHETMDFIIDCLEEKDRLSVISFDTSSVREFPLIRMNKENKDKAMKTIKMIGPRGSTNIVSGMEIAFKTAKERKYKNPVTSIFLLSDGQDDTAKAARRTENMFNLYKLDDTFTIHSFGFGNDHDENEMNAIAELKGGQFY